MPQYDIIIKYTIYDNMMYYQIISTIFGRCDYYLQMLLTDIAAYPFNYKT